MPHFKSQASRIFAASAFALTAAMVEACTFGDLDKWTGGDASSPAEEASTPADAAPPDVLVEAAVDGSAAPAEACGTLSPGRRLVTGESITSCDGRFLLSMQTDGSFMLFQGGSVLWSANTNGQKAYRLEMQPDGNLVLYDAQAAAIWSTITGGNPGAHLLLQDDGNAVVYFADQALWSSGTPGH